MGGLGMLEVVPLNQNLAASTEVLTPALEWRMQSTTELLTVV